MHLISIIIPVLNEETSILIFLKKLQQFRDNGHEIILVDGGSTDNTVKLSENYVNQIIISKPCRSTQMNSGAKHAKNNILLFLHSDTFLPDLADTIISSSLSGSKVWGRFNIKLSGKSFIYRIIETMINFRSQYTSIATGDQAIFVTKKTFESINGYPDILLMEDIAISKILRQQNQCACLSDKVVTSSRRWEKHGIFRTILLMWLLRLLYFVGVHPDKLHKLYYAKR